MTENKNQKSAKNILSGMLVYTKPTFTIIGGSHMLCSTVSTQGDWKNTDEARIARDTVIECFKVQLREKQFPTGSKVDFIIKERRPHIVHDLNSIILSVVIHDGKKQETENKLIAFMQNTLKAGPLNNIAVGM